MQKFGLKMIVHHSGYCFLKEVNPGRESSHSSFAQMADYKLGYPIGKLIDDKMAAAFDLNEAIGTDNKLLGEFRGAATNTSV
jgi:hypothetical protein